MAIFPTIEVGRNAKSDLMKGPSYFDKSIEEALIRYSPPHENPHIQSHIRRISKELNVSKDTPLNSLSTLQFENFIKGIEINEGRNRPAKTYMVPKNSPVNAELRENKTISLLWASKQPITSLKKEDIRAIIRSSAYRNKRHSLHEKMQKTVMQWFEAQEWVNGKESVHVDEHTREG